ncbi:hypothetical protein HKD37_07G018734 [Glycine soja]
MDQSYSEVSRWKDELEHTWHLLDSNDNIHFVTYNQDLMSLTLDRTQRFLWTHLKSSSDHDPFWVECFLPNHLLLSEYKVTCSNLVNVSSTMYSFMKAVRFTHLNLEGIMECRIVYNHWRKNAKIGNGWGTFVQSQNLQKI